MIAELGLRHVKDTKVGGVEIRGISGGERETSEHRRAASPRPQHPLLG